MEPIQNRFGFVQALDDARDKTIDGWPPAGWIGRCYHATAEEALKDARRAVPLLGRLYVTEFPVDPPFQRYWPHLTYWMVRTHEPMNGQIIGAFYHERPNHYVVDYIVGKLTEIYVEGEDELDIRLGSQEAAGRFIMNEWRSGQKIDQHYIEDLWQAAGLEIR